LLLNFSSVIIYSSFNEYNYKFLLYILYLCVLTLSCFNPINPGVLGNWIYVTLRYNFLQCCVIFVTICIRKIKKKKGDVKFSAHDAFLVQNSRVYRTIIFAMCKLGFVFRHTNAFSLEQEKREIKKRRNRLTYNVMFASFPPMIKIDLYDYILDSLRLD
jgi:hypothetical protein